MDPITRQLVETIKTIQKEDYDLIAGMQAIAPSVIAAGTVALPVVLPGIIDRIRDFRKQPITRTRSSVPPPHVNRDATPKDLDVTNQINDAVAHLEGIEARRARAEGRNPNRITDEDVARLVQNRLRAASGVMTRRVNRRSQV